MTTVLRYYAGTLFITTLVLLFGQFVGEQGSGLGFQCYGQLQERGKCNVDHSLFDLGDLTVVDAAGIRHFAEAKALLLTELS